jgi:hypothetical protein
LVRINKVSLDVQPRPKRFQMSVGERLQYNFTLLVIVR